MRLRRAKLLRTALAACLIVVAANAVVRTLEVKYWRPDERLWRANTYAFQRSGFDADLLVVGSSRILFGVNAVGLEEELAALPDAPSVFNIGQAAGNAFKNLVVLRDVFRSNGCPETVLLEMSPGLVNGAQEQRRFIQEYATLRDLPLLAPELDSARRLDAFLTSGLGGPIALWYHWVDPPPDEMIERALERQGGRWGRHPPARSRRLDGETIRRRGDDVRDRRLERFLSGYTVEGVPARALEAIVELVAACDARLILVRLPSFIPSSPETERIELVFRAYVDEFARRTGTPFHDIRLASVGLRPEHYNDFAHLNHDGAALLTSYLAREILLPALRRPR